MDDSGLDISSLIEKYEQMRLLGRKMYFDADEFALLADHYRMDGNNDEADELITEGLTMHPGSPDLLLLKIKMLVLESMYDEALEEMRQLPEDIDVELPVLKFESLIYTNQLDEADELLDRTMERDWSVDDIYFFITEIGFLFNDAGMYTRAIAFLEESLKIDEFNTEALIDLAYAYEMMEDVDKAIEYNNRALDTDPYSFDGWANMGKLFSMKGQYDKAIDAFDFALTINEVDVDVLKMKGLAYYLNDNVQEAITIFEICLDILTYDEQLHDSLLDAYEAMGFYDEMMKLIDLKKSRFGNKGILAKRAYVYLLQDDVEQAREIFGQIPEDEQDTLDYYLLEGELAFQVEDYKSSESSFMKALLVSKDNEDVLDRLANVSVALEKYEQAAAYLMQLLKISPDFPTAKSRLAFVRFEIGSKEPFDDIMEQFSDEELRELLNLIMGYEDIDFSDYNREKLLIRLNEARENRVLFKNSKY